MNSLMDWESNDITAIVHIKTIEEILSSPGNISVVKFLKMFYLEL